MINDNYKVMFRVTFSIISLTIVSTMLVWTLHRSGELDLFAIFIVSLVINCLSLLTGIFEIMDLFQKREV